MGGYNPKNPLVPRLKEAAELLFAIGYEIAGEDVEEAIAVIEGRLVVGPDGLTRLPAETVSEVEK